MHRTVRSIPLLLSMVACEGPVGPEGPQGAPGSTSVSTGTFTVVPSAYVDGFWYFPVDGGTQGNPARVATVSVPAISADLASNGTVLVYLRVPSTSTQPANQWTLLPFHQGGFGGGYLVSIKAAVEPGRIRIGYAHEATGASAAPDVYGVTLPTYEFRWIGIHGMAAGSLAARLTLDDPNAVVAALQGGR